jgi:hypothetical protein
MKKLIKVEIEVLDEEHCGDCAFLRNFTHECLLFCDFVKTDINENENYLRTDQCKKGGEG